MNSDQARQRWAAMGAEERLAMAKVCPKVAGRWSALGIIRREENGEVIASVLASRNGWGYWAVGIPVRRFAFTLDEGKGACDAALLAAGYVLDDGGADG